MKKKEQSKFIRKRVTEGPCMYCQSKKMPVWKDYEKLGIFLTARGRLLPSSLTGLCKKHQKRMVAAVKQARHLAMMPFVTAG